MRLCTSGSLDVSECFWRVEWHPHLSLDLRLLKSMTHVVRVKFWFCKNWRCCAKLPQAKALLCSISCYINVRRIPSNKIKLDSVISNQVIDWTNHAYKLMLLKYSRSTYFGLFRYFIVLFSIEKNINLKIHWKLYADSSPTLSHLFYLPLRDLSHKTVSDYVSVQLPLICCSE